ncbi:hypothetical protein LCGC14_0445020 [marine sediment metagenome]|uniref:Uncharacterized protein n=1 Tax=marine sediment metagenome TaxID=412755 RepID=A0A0F9SJ91_9ZZZZ
MATTTLQQIRELMIDRYELGRRGQTTVGSTKVALTDDFNFGGHSAKDGIVPGCEVKITSGVSGGDVCRLSSSPVRTTGAMNLDPGTASDLNGATTTLDGNVTAEATSMGWVGFSDFPLAGTYVVKIDSEHLLVTDGAGTKNVTVRRAYLNSVAASHSSAATVTLMDNFDILFRPFKFEGPNSFLSAIQDAQLIIPEKLIVPITLVTDGDMLASGIGTWGTESNTVATKSAASFPFGLREMLTTNSVVNGYLPSASIGVDSDQAYYLEATARVNPAGPATATARLDCQDLTNSVALDVENDNTTQQEPEILSSVVQMGSATERVEIRIGADESNALPLWSNVIFMKSGLSEFLVQDRAEVDRLGKLFVATRNIWGSRGLLEIGGAPEQLTEGLWRWQTAERVSGRSVWYEEFRKASALSADADTTSAPVEHVAAIAAELLLQPLADQDEWRARYFRAARDSAAARDKYEPQRTYVNRAPKVYAQPLV